MRRIVVLLSCLAALPLAGCGGSKVAYTEVTQPPPTLAMPADTGGVVATRTPSASVTASPTAGTAAGTTSSGTTSSGTTGTGTSSGAATGGAAPTATATATPAQNTGGTSPDQNLDQFCADNPGACNGTSGK